MRSTAPPAWRAGLARNSGSAPEVWLAIRRRGGTGPGVPYGEAIEQALCFGWIDSHARRRLVDRHYVRTYC